MNDSEIIELLETCGEIANCKKCSFYNAEKNNCLIKLNTYALDLIKRQQAEIDRLNIDLKAMRGAANSWKAEVERICKKELDNIEIDIETVKSKAVREFAEKLKKLAMAERICVEQGRYVNISYVNVCDIDRLLEEMGCNDG